MFTVRASTLESFRLYLDPDVDFISADEMDARLRGEPASSPAADLGTAWHAAIANTYTGPIRFAPESLQRARQGLDGASSEVEGQITLDVGGQPVRVTGHADWLLGLDMLEHKSSLKPIAPEKHADSLQWRCYALIFGVKRVVYRQAQLEESRDDGEFRAAKIDDVTMYRYPGLHDDVVRCVGSLLGYARARGLVLPEVT